jgi:hypothetical protein
MSLSTAAVPLTSTIILDSGATGTFVSPDHAAYLCDAIPITHGPTVVSASGDIMKPTLSGNLAHQSSATPPSLLSS